MVVVDVDTVNIKNDEIDYFACFTSKFMKRFDGKPSKFDEVEWFLTNMMKGLFEETVEWVDTKQWLQFVMKLRTLQESGILKRSSLFRLYNLRKSWQMVWTKSGLLI